MKKTNKRYIIKENNRVWSKEMKNHAGNIVKKITKKQANLGWKLVVHKTKHDNFPVIGPEFLYTLLIRCLSLCVIEFI